MATKQCKSCKRELPIARFDRVRNDNTRKRRMSLGVFMRRCEERHEAA